MMTNTVLLGLGFSVGSLGREIVRIAYGRYMTWRFNRDFRLTNERMIGCKHNRTILTDCGMGLVTYKCLDCWALHIPMMNGFEWSANSASPKEAEKLTRELQGVKVRVVRTRKTKS